MVTIQNDPKKLIVPITNYTAAGGWFGRADLRVSSVEGDDEQTPPLPPLVSLAYLDGNTALPNCLIVPAPSYFSMVTSP